MILEEMVMGMAKQNKLKESYMEPKDIPLTDWMRLQ